MKISGYQLRALLSSIIAGVFIYFRKLDYYRTMPRQSITVSVSIIVWSWLNYLEPLCLPLGLVIINLVGYKHVFTEDEH